ncbi:unnamed protein product [Phyllotreta striolata]|uniref:Protein-lysine N-methyltransferase SMYD4 n=1 Tax=Phyllotreta striolata TaxID=444603 RepID=A0A9N9TK92_PHYSR|nr:unnamed protein product [Phyllotreta striolata]
MNINSIIKNLQQNLAENDRIKTVSKHFAGLHSNGDRVAFVRGLLEETAVLPRLVSDAKNDRTSATTRERGNEHFKRRRLKDAIDSYTQSLAHAETPQNYSKALANRSAALFELQLYPECLTDIDRALENGYPDDLKPKLLRRKDNALKLLESKTYPPYYLPVPVIPEPFKSKSIECASDSIEIATSPSQGRHIIATRDIQIGEVLAVEEPYSSLLSSEYYIHCHECLKLCYNLLPCSKCTEVFYCDDACRTEALEYHQYECSILKTLRSLGLTKMQLLPFKIALGVKEIPSARRTGLYKSDRYAEIHDLVANTERRTVADLFERAATAAAIHHLLHKHTSFFEASGLEDLFDEVLMLHLQTAPCNFHEISESAPSDGGDGVHRTAEIGAGAYAFLSLFNHGCDPNVARHCHGRAIVVRAIRRIAEGEECRDNYGYHFAITSKPERLESLKKQYFFDCSCSACSDDWPLFEALPRDGAASGLADEDLAKLSAGARRSAAALASKLPPLMGGVEAEAAPGRAFAEMQEALKQCYALLGNRRLK